MKLQAVKNAVTSTVGRQILKGRKHSPTILFAGGVVGVVGSTVLACRATLKLEEVLEESQKNQEMANTLQHKNYSEADRANDLKLIKIQTAAQVVKLYGPAIALGVVSVAALTGSHVIMSRRNAAVVAAYSALDKGFRDYRDRVREELGEEKDHEFRHGTETRSETVVGEDGKSKKVEHTSVPDGMPSIYARFFDDQSSMWSKDVNSSRFFLHCQQRYANDLLNIRGHVFLNEVYDMLKLPRSKEGQFVGWVKGNGDDYIDFGIFDGENLRKRMFVNGEENVILLDFNVDGPVYDLI